MFSSAVQVDDAARNPSLLLGVLSTAGLVSRRNLVRSTWGGSRLRHRCMLNFILAEHDERNDNVAAEQRTHADLFFAHGIADGSVFYAEKLFVWLSHAVRAAPPSAGFVGFADDDAYVSVDGILSDLDTVKANGRAERAVVAAFQWFAYDRMSGQPDAWGPSLRSVRGSEHAWRAHTGLRRSLWPGGATQGKAWKGCRASLSTQQPPSSGGGNDVQQPRRRGGGDGNRGGDGVPQELSSASASTPRGLRPRHPHLSLPFPLAKGPMVAIGRAVAAELADGAYSLAERAHAAAAMFRKSFDEKLGPLSRLANETTATASPSTASWSTASSRRTPSVQFARVLHDVFLSYLMGTARSGLGLPNLTLVDLGVGPAKGYAEARVSKSKAVSKSKTGRLAASGEAVGKPAAVDDFEWTRLLTIRMRVAHFGRKFVKITSQRRWPDVPWRDKAADVLREGFIRLHERHAELWPHSRAEGRPSKVYEGLSVESGRSQSRLRCTRTDWWSNSRCLVATGADWTTCTLE